MSPAVAAASRERRTLLRHVLVPVALLLFLAAALNGFLIGRIGDTLDEKALASQSQSVSAVMKRLLQRQETFVADYAWWDEFYLSTRDGRVAEWGAENLANTVGDTWGTSQTFVFDERGRMRFGWSIDGEADARHMSIDSGLARLRRAALAVPERDAAIAISAYVSLDGQPYFAAASVIAPVAKSLRNDPRRPRNVLIALTPVSKAAYPQLAEDFGLDHLNFSMDAPLSGAAAVLLTDVDGRRVGYMTWALESQLGAFMSGYWPWAAGLLFLICAALTFLSIRWRGLVHRLVSVSIAARAAEASSSAKSTFIASMSHELRTPLNAIIGFSDIMASEQFGPHSSPKYREYSADIMTSGQHLLSVINDILSLARIEAGKHQVHVAPCSVDATVREAVRMLEGLAAARGVRLKVKREHMWVEALADATALRQCLINLISNALKFTPTGGKVTLSWSGRRIDGMVEITVADTGAGIPADKLPLLGTPFYQVEEGQSGGTGLGLSIVRGLVAAMNGQLMIDSTEGEGTHVRIRLPTARWHVQRAA